VEPRAAPNAEFQQTLGALSDLLELAAVTRRDIVETRAVVMDRRMAHRLGCAAGSRWLCVSYIRRPLKPSARPMAWVDCYVDERYGPVLDDLASDPGLVSDRIAHQFGVVAVEVHQSVAARRLDAARAKALAAAAQSPALEVVRRYLDASGRLFEISHSIHPADRYAVTTVLKRVASRGSGGSAA
jgi:DNA-binding GntR family transcriptional regulator